MCNFNNIYNEQNTCTTLTFFQVLEKKRSVFKVSESSEDTNSHLHTRKYIPSLFSSPIEHKLLVFVAMNMYVTKYNCYKVYLQMYHVLKQKCKPALLLNYSMPLKKNFYGKIKKPQSHSYK